MTAVKYVTHPHLRPQPRRDGRHGHPTINAAQDQWENDVHGEFFTKDQVVLGNRDNSRGIYWSNLWSHPRPRFAWVHSDYLQDSLFWDKVTPVVS
jgi:hypothetical protein